MPSSLLRATLAIFVGFAVVATSVSFVAPTEVDAQVVKSKKKRKSFFDIFRGDGSRRAAREKRREERRVRRNRAPTVTRRSSGPRQAPAVVVLPKDPDARKVVVFGGTLSKGVASGLDAEFAEDPTVEVVDRSRPGSGLADLATYDWPAVIDDYLQTNPSDFVVVMFGLDDRRGIDIEGQEVEFRSTPWETTYLDRIRTVLQVLEDRRKRSYWVGLPPMKVTALSIDMEYMNGLIRDQIPDRRTEYVDIWDSFLTEEGRYSSFGPDVNGIRRRLRPEAGVTFTRSGNRKLAFFVAREIRRIVSQEIPVSALPDGLTEEEINAIRRPDPASSKIRIISLNSPSPGFDEDLIPDGSVGPPANQNDPARDRLLEGRQIRAQRGRVDDFQWARDLPVSDPPPIRGELVTN